MDLLLENSHSGNFHFFCRKSSFKNHLNYSILRNTVSLNFFFSCTKSKILSRKPRDHSINIQMSNDPTKEALLKRRRHHNTTSNANDQEQQNGSIIDPLHYPESIFTAQLSIKQVSTFLAAYLAIGAFCFYLVRDQIRGKKTNGILDAVYFCVVTMTTVGYGDLVPDTILAKFLACVFVFTGMALVGYVLSKAADYIVEKEEVLLVKAIHLREKCGPNEILKEAETYRAKYKFIMTLILIFVLVVVGTLFLALVEELSFFDAFYCVCATITTLGYGDTSFSTKKGRFFAIFWILISTISLAQFFLYLAEVYTENRRRLMINWVLTRKMTVSDLEAADLDNDKSVSAAEFVVYKLKEMGKINEEDIAIVMDKFRNLDVDHSGTLTINDLKLSQTPQTKS